MMKQTILAYKLQIQKWEVEAADKVNEIFLNPIELQRNRKALNNRLIDEISGIESKSIKEGKRFGKFLYDLAIERMKGKKRKKIAAKKGKGQTVKKARFSLKDERKFFIMELNRHQAFYLEWLRIISARLIARGLNEKEIISHFQKRASFLIEFDALKNRLRMAVANHINLVSDIGYYKGLGL